MDSLAPDEDPPEPTSPPPTYTVDLEQQVNEALTDQLVALSIAPTQTHNRHPRPGRPRRRSSLGEFHLPAQAPHRPLPSTSRLNSPARPQSPDRHSTAAEHPFASAVGLLRRVQSDDHLTSAPADSCSSDSSDLESDAESYRVRPPSIASVSSHRSSRGGVSLEDRSARGSPGFAQAVRIVGFYAVGEKAGGFVVFDIEITSKEGTVLHALKRYSAFVQLRNELLRQLPHLRNQLPRLPPKSGLAKFRATFLEKRRRDLAWWLTCVCMHPEAGACALLKSWILDRT